MNDGSDGWLDLASARLGGRALIANDEFFAPKENLLAAGRGVFIDDKYTDRGKWMDGWETRRRRTPGHDWCIVQLGAPGRIRQVIVDTNHFRGNFPESASLDACFAAPEVDAERLAAAATRWREIVPRRPLVGDAENRFAVDSSIDDAGCFSHVRLNIYPDGGVARLRVFGEVDCEPARWATAELPLDLAAARLGGAALACSDAFFSRPLNLIMPGRGVNMGDGWETRRRRGPGHDWAILRLACRGLVEALVVDTAHFKGNFPDTCRLEGCDAPGIRGVPDDGRSWFEILPRAQLGADQEHHFTELAAQRAVTHVRLSIYPDGGVSRLRVLGRPLEPGR